MIHEKADTYRTLDDDFPLGPVVLVRHDGNVRRRVRHELGQFLHCQRLLLTP